MIISFYALCRICSPLGNWAGGSTQDVHCRRKSIVVVKNVTHERWRYDNSTQAKSEDLVARTCTFSQREPARVITQPSLHFYLGALFSAPVRGLSWLTQIYSCSNKLRVPGAPSPGLRRGPLVSVRRHRQVLLQGRIQARNICTKNMTRHPLILILRVGPT